MTLTEVTAAKWGDILAPAKIITRYGDDVVETACKSAWAGSREKYSPGPHLQISNVSVCL